MLAASCSAISMSKTASSSSDIEREEEEVDGSGSPGMVPLIFGTLLQLPDYSGRDVVGSEIILFLAMLSRLLLSDRQQRNYLLPKFFMPFVVLKKKIMYDRRNKNILRIYANNMEIL